MCKISLVSGLVKDPEDSGRSISFMHFNSYYLTGIISASTVSKDYNNIAVLCTDIKYYVQWIREILNKHVSKYIFICINIYF